MDGRQRQRRYWIKVVGTGWVILYLYGAISYAKSPSAPPPPNNPVVVHEWGTFTSLQDENGEAIGGINADDEPVPSFVHRIADGLIVSPSADARALFKGAPRCHPDVTMRLETPVVYFHPQDSTVPVTLDVTVAFRSGWLSEYFPDADVEAPGVTGALSFGPIRASTMGKISWRNVKLSQNAQGPETASHVWLAPRDVDAASVTTPGGESEKFLFYRGVGRIDSPVRVTRDEPSHSLDVLADFSWLAQLRGAEVVVPAVWLVETRADGATAFRSLGRFSVSSAGAMRLAQTPATFEDHEFDKRNVERLNSDMRKALIADGLFADGLFADEADALLNTWKASYFQSPGLRLFYLLPQAWTDHVLPMTISGESTLVRTMVGRVEIVTPRQRSLLGVIADGPASNAEGPFESTPHDRADAAQAADDEPVDYRAYQELGRFRNALVLDELKRRPTPAIEAFIELYGLDGYKPGE